MYTTCEEADGEKVDCTWLNKEGSGILLGRDQNWLYIKCNVFLFACFKNQCQVIFKFYVLSWYSTVYDMSCENPRFKLDHITKKPKGKKSWRIPYKYSTSLFIFAVLLYLYIKSNYK